MKFLTANIEEDITALGQEIQGLKQQIAQANQKRVHLDAENQQNVSAERRTETQLMKIRETKRKCVMVTLKIFIYEPRYEKTGLRGFGPGPTKTGLYSHRRWLEAKNFVRFSHDAANIIKTTK